MKLEFPQITTCTEKCPLKATCKNSGIPTRSLLDNLEICHDTALLIVGEAPGHQEDLQNRSWIGFSGQLLAQFTTAAGFHDSTDVYLSNACRCRPDYNTNPTQGQVSQCRKFLQTDLDTLKTHYDRVIILCCGAAAAKSVSNMKSLSKAFTYQGHSLADFGALTSRGPKPLIDSPNSKSTFPTPVFFTYHPAMLAPGRKPALVTAVQDHFTLLRRYLGGTYSPPSTTVRPDINQPFNPLTDFTTYIPPEISLDIETYGILKGINQTVYHPDKAYHIDSIPYCDQIVSVALSYYEKNGDIRSLYFDFKAHKNLFHGWLAAAIAHNIPILGQNIKFDVQFLKRCDPVSNNLLMPHRCILDDTMLWSFLLFEQRPERGLKELSRLFGLADYSSSKVTGSSGTASGPLDPDLIYYNVLDTLATLRLKTYAKTEIIRTYGPDTTKLSPLCSQMRNWSIWSAIDLESSGITYDYKQLKTLHTTSKARMSILSDQMKTDYALIMSGTGSDTSKRQFLIARFNELNLLTDSRTTYTAKTNELSVGNQNFELLFNSVPEGYQYTQAVKTLQEYSDLEKMTSSFTGPLIHKSAKGYCAPLSSGVVIAYPSWYPWPAYDSKQESSGTVGGTIQARFACKQPPVQNFPPPIKKSLRSRFGAEGRISGYDLSQIELRIAALLSGDPVMLYEYANHIDRHTETGFLFAPGADPTSSSFRDRERQLGKTLNFLVLYLGGAAKFQETAMIKLGIPLSLAFCHEVIYQFDLKYAVFRAWQQALLREATQRGHITVLTGWSRSFSKGPSALESYRNEICNFPIQLTAAQLMQSAEFAIISELRARRLRTCICAQIHDALYPDIYLPEEEEVDKIMKKYLTRPPLLLILEEHFGRTIEIEYKKENL